MNNNQCLYLLCNPNKWFGDNNIENYQVNELLKKLDTEDWTVNNLKNIYIGMKGIIKVSTDTRPMRILKEKNVKKLESGIYATFEVTNFTPDRKGSYIDIKIIDNFFKNNKVIRKENAKKILGNKFNAQSQGYITYETYKTILEHQNSTIFSEKTSENANNILPEGARKEICVNAYERNIEARRRCIEHHGLNCAVCNMNFESVYGEIGKDFIHVHHLTPLSEIKKEYEIDPIQDLNPVCPNCHAMLHKKKGIPYSIKELKNKLLIKF